MPRKGRDLENLVRILEGALAGAGVRINSPDYIIGKKSQSRREVDVAIRSQVGSANVLVIFECRDRQKTEDVTWIEQLAKKREDVGADKAVAVSTSGFSAGAENAANAENVELRALEAINAHEIALWLGMSDLDYTYIQYVFDHIEFGCQSEGAGNSENARLALDGYKQAIDLHAPIFQRPSDGAKLSFMDLWKLVPKDKVHPAARPNGPDVPFSVRVNFDQIENRPLLSAANETLTLVFFEAKGAAQVKRQLLPISSTYTYRSKEGRLFESADFDFPYQDGIYTFTVSKHIDTGRQHISLRAKEADRSLIAKIDLMKIDDSPEE